MSPRALGTVRVTRDHIRNLTQRVLEIEPDDTRSWKQALEEVKGISNKAELDEVDIVKALKQLKSYIDAHTTKDKGYRVIYRQYYDTMTAWLNTQIKREYIKTLEGRCKQGLGEMSMGEYTSMARMCGLKIEEKMGDVERLKKFRENFRGI